MPFVVFFKGGFGVHGTTGSAKAGNISLLGTVPLSHGCVRIHPLNAKAFNEAVAQYGRTNTWVYVHP
jgi:lipoprotein-anchoring transpeptidase ErfK/SrfK